MSQTENQGDLRASRGRQEFRETLLLAAIDTEQTIWGARLLAIESERGADGRNDLHQLLRA